MSLSLVCFKGLLVPRYAEIDWSADLMRQDRLLSESKICLRELDGKRKTLDVKLINSIRTQSQSRCAC